VVAILKSLSDNPSEQEIEDAVSQIPDEEQRGIARDFLLDPNIREMFREKFASAA